ncbi:uncharacterized protein LOC144919965 [Branchiostoma floridae x Branchiostoma belcheri]
MASRLGRFLLVLAACARCVPVQTATISTPSSTQPKIFNNTCSLPHQSVFLSTRSPQDQVGPFRLTVTVRYYSGEKRTKLVSSSDLTNGLDTDNHLCHLGFTVKILADSSDLPGLEKMEEKSYGCIIKFPGVPDDQYAPDNFFTFDKVDGSDDFHLRFTGNYLTTKETRGPYAQNTWECQVSASGEVNDWRPLSMDLTVDYEGCPVGYYGASCTESCVCQNGGTCHPFNGACHCPIGFTGPTCYIVDRRVTARIEPEHTLYITESAALVCEVVNLGDRTVTWRFGDEVLNRNYSVVRHPTYIESRVFIDNITDADNGEYTCEARSQDGSIASDTVTLDVTECTAGWRGVSCDLRCDCSVNSVLCHRFDGCVCRPGWTGDTCETTLPPPTGVTTSTPAPTVLVPGTQSADDWTTPVIAVVVLLVVVAAAGVLVYWFRRRAPPKHSFGLSEDLLDRVRQSQWMKDPSDVTFLDQIGQGEFGHVVRAQVKEGGASSILAAKGLRGDNVRSTGKYSFERELKVLLDLTEDGGHPNIIQLCGIILTKGLIYILLEYVGKRDLQGLLRAVNMKATIPSSFGRECLSYARDVVSGLAYLDRSKVVHRDLAARNILISNDNVAKLSDFGLSCGIYRELSETKNEDPLPWRWMAPECLRYDDEFSSKSDVWSFGIVLWEMATLGATPYPYITSQQKLLRYLIRNKERMAQPSRCSDAVYQVMLSCWQESPNHRPAAVSLEGIFSGMLALNKEIFKPSVYEYEEDML